MANDKWETRDMSLAAWMHANNKRIVSLTRTHERRKEFIFVFRDKEQECPNLALDFLNSDAHRFDTALRSLKKMCFGPNGIRSAIVSG